MNQTSVPEVKVKVVGVGGAGGNAVSRMAEREIPGVGFLALNTDAQALNRMKNIPSHAIGPVITGGMGSGGNAEVGRKAVKESQERVSGFIEGSDMVFITAGMGGGTGTGAAPVVADLAKKQGALTVAVVTRPFSFEGDRRKQLADRGLQQLAQKVDTLIVVENDRLLSSIDGKLSLEKAFQLADEVLRQGVQGISEIITVSGLVNVDFADVKSVMAGAGPSFMAIGEGKGRSAATAAVQQALSNPLFDAPLEGARGVLFNIKGGKELSIGQVHEVADIIRNASHAQAQVIFGVVHDKKWKKRVGITLVGTGVSSQTRAEQAPAPGLDQVFLRPQLPRPATASQTNGRVPVASISRQTLE